MSKANQNLTTKEYWVNAIPIVAVFAGIISLLIGYLRQFENSHWNEFFKVVGTTILASGIFSFMVKYARFAKIFKSELNEIIYESKYLEQQKNIVDIWERVSKVVFKNKFPKISKDIINDVKNIYFPTDHVLYYNNFNQTLEIELLDKEAEKIRVIQHSKFEIFPKSTSEQCNLEGRNALYFDGDPSNVSFKISSFIINKKNIETNHKEELIDNKLVSTYNIPLTGLSSYNVEIEIEKEYSLKYDNIIAMMKRYIIHDFTLKIVLKGDIAFNFIKIGTLNEFTKAKVKNPAFHEYDYKGIIYPKQGYLMILKLK